MITDTLSNIWHVPTRYSAVYYSVLPIWVTIQRLSREVGALRSRERHWAPTSLKTSIAVASRSVASSGEHRGNEDYILYSHFISLAILSKTIFKTNSSSNHLASYTIC